MSLFRKEALEHRSRALFGEVILRGPIASWVITALLILVMGLLIAGLFLVSVSVVKIGYGDSGRIKARDAASKSGA